MNDAQSRQDAFEQLQDDEYDLSLEDQDDQGVHLPDDALLDPQGCDVCGTKTGNHAALCPDILDGLAMSIRPQGDDMFDFLTDLGHKLRDASYNLEN